MHVWLRGAGFVDGGYCGGGEDYDGDVLRDCCFAVIVALGIIGGGFVECFIIIIVGAARERVVGECGCKGCGGATAACCSGGEVVGDYGEGEEGDVVFFCEADGC